MAVGRNFDGSIEYVVESTYGGGAGTDPTMLAVSDFVTNATVGVGDEHDVLKTISSQTVQDYFKKPRDYTFHLEYIPQNNTLLDDVITRTNSSLQSLFFDVGVNTSQTTSSYYELSGCKPKTVKIEGKNGDPWKITVDFSVKTVTTSTSEVDVGNGSHASSIGSDALTFNVAGSITWGGSSIAYITDSITIDIDNGLVDHFDVGSLTKKDCVESNTVTITGSCDISLDDGGKDFWDSLVNGTENTLVVNMGSSGAPKLTLTGVRFKNLEIPQNITGGTLIQSVPFTAKTITVGTV